MASITRFEDIEAWRKSRELTNSIYELTNRGAFSKDFPLRDQIRRASISIMSNIAEGFDRGGDKEFRQFLSTAKGSVAEVRSQLYIALDANYIDQVQFEKLSATTIDITNLIGGFMRYLKSTEKRGHKFNAKES